MAKVAKAEPLAAQVTSGELAELSEPARPRAPSCPGRASLAAAGAHYTHQPQNSGHFWSHPCLCCPVGWESCDLTASQTLLSLSWLFSSSFSCSVLLQSQREGSAPSSAFSTRRQAPPVHQQSCSRSSSFPGRHPMPLFFLSAPNPHPSPPCHPLSEGSARKQGIYFTSSSLRGEKTQPVHYLKVGV